jgi:site-specific DNA recombinase
MSPTTIHRVQRCAVYARKSTADEWDRDFNSIESQHDICSAYITCQLHKSWLELPHKYDDPGQSGGTLSRPALQRLLRDIECGEIDVVVIYKIDRLTRSLADFVRLVEVFDRYNVKFVSVTQTFDTSDSMGRLVLNILLTFAQFERELIADRIRDKVAAMKRRGKIVGGGPPYGYDIVNRRLVVNSAEAEQVKSIFRRFLEAGSCSALYRLLKAEGMRSKAYVTRAGHVRGGGPASQAMIYHMLKSPIYIGRVPHKGESYPGEHEAIIDQETWDAAQRLTESRRPYNGNLRPTPFILRSLFHDSKGRRMVVNGRNDRQTYYRYYQSEQSRWAAREGIKRFRIRAERLEELVVAAVQAMLCDRERVRGALRDIGRYGEDLDILPRRSASACRRLTEANLKSLREILCSLIVEGEISEHRLLLVFRSSEVVRFIAWDGIALFVGDRAAWSVNEPTFTVTRPLDEFNPSIERRLVMPIEPIAPQRRGKREPALIKLIHTARRAQAAVDAERDASVEELAAQFNCSPSRFCRVLRLNYLAPDIVSAILAGAQPKGVTSYKFLHGTLPLDWDLQRRMFGFPARSDLGIYPPRDGRDAETSEHQTFVRRTDRKRRDFPGLAKGEGVRERSMTQP